MRLILGTALDGWGRVRLTLFGLTLSLALIGITYNYLNEVAPLLSSLILVVLPLFTMWLFLGIIGWVYRGFFLSEHRLSRLRLFIVIVVGALPVVSAGAAVLSEDELWRERGPMSLQLQTCNDLAMRFYMRAPADQKYTPSRDCTDEALEPYRWKDRDRPYWVDYLANSTLIGFVLGAGLWGGFWLIGWIFRGFFGRKEENASVEG